MKLNELGFDYSNLNSCTLKRKSYLMAVIVAIMGVTFVIIFITFMILYALKLPMHINDVQVYPGDPQYEQFYLIFLIVTGIVSAVTVGLMGLNFFQKPRVILVMDNDVEYNRFYYIYDRRKQDEIYLTEKYAIVYHKRYHTVYQETNPNEIQNLFDKFVFWKSIERMDDYTIKQKANKTILKAKEKSARGFSTIYRTYSFSNDINVVPSKVTETVNVRTAGNYRTQAFYTYFFEDINRKPQIDIHPEIKRTLSNMI